MLKRGNSNNGGGGCAQDIVENPSAESAGPADNRPARTAADIPTASALFMAMLLLRGRGAAAGQIVGPAPKKGQARAGKRSKSSRVGLASPLG